MIRLKDHNWLIAGLGLLLLVGCDQEKAGEEVSVASADGAPLLSEQPRETRTEEPGVTPSDSTAILDAMRSIRLGDESLELNWAMLGDIGVDFGGTGFRREEPEASQWLCFDSADGLRLLFGAPEIPGEGHTLEMFAAGPSEWVGGPRQCEGVPVDWRPLVLGNGLAVGDDAARVIELLSEPQEHQGAIYRYRAWKEPKNGLSLLGELDVLIEDGEVVGMRGLRCYCAKPAGTDAG